MTWTHFPAGDFAAYAGIWNRLNAAGPDSPVLHADFIGPALDEFGHGDERLAIFKQPDDPLAMVLLTRSRPGVWQNFQPSQLPLGPWLDRSSRPIAGLLRDLAGSLPGIVITLGLSQQDPDFCARPPGGAYLDTLDYIETARIRIDEPFSEYWAKRGKNLRQNLNRQRNRLRREGVETRLESVTAPAAMAAAVRDYGLLESAGWKAGEGTAIHPDNAQGRFYTRILEAFGQRRQARLYRFWYGDKLVASDICIEQGGTLIILKTTFDESITTTSPAMLMRQAYFAQIFGEGSIRRIEFYGRLMEWHKRLTDDTRTLFHINYRPWPIVEKLRRLFAEQSVERTAS